MELAAVVQYKENRIELNTKACRVYSLVLATYHLFFFFSSQGGFYLFNIFNDYSAAYSLFVVGALEMIIVSWLYGTF